MPLLGAVQWMSTGPPVEASVVPTSTSPAMKSKFVKGGTALPPAVDSITELLRFEALAPQ